MDRKKTVPPGGFFVAGGANYAKPPQTKPKMSK
jgi:hypothetical protein